MLPKENIFFFLLWAITTVGIHVAFGIPSNDQIISLLENRIVGGIEAEPHEFPHIVSLQFRNRHFCGGSIINENWVLTAGHCIPDYKVDFVVKAGKHLVATEEKSEQTVRVIKTIVHKYFAGVVKPYDIALVKLKKPLIFNEYVQPIALPKKDSEVEGDVIIAGWGSVQPSGYGTSRQLQKANLHVIDLFTCKKAFESLSSEPAPLKDSNLCTGPFSGGVSACSGDSGGPLSKHENGHSELVGIVSWGHFPCGTRGAPSVFTKVSSYIDWIEDIIANN